MLNVTAEITRDQAAWRRKEEEHTAKYNELRSSILFLRLLMDEPQLRGLSLVLFEFADILLELLAPITREARAGCPRIRKERARGHEAEVHP
jgi:hypothetical protein